MSSKKIKALSNHEIVTLAVYLLGGASKRIDSEDVAVKANELAPGRFTWRKYPEQINLKNISAFLWDAGKPKNGSQLIGTDVDGWMLTESGLKFAQVRVKKLENVNLARNSISPKERNLLRRERERMLSSDAFTKFSENQSDAISVSEAESFFRVDAYVTGDARMEKILRAKNRFGEDPELGALIKLLETKLAKGN
jgi:hypothetical protein